jgi:myo-inositol-1(or 4)-monophosphatase
MTQRDYEHLTLRAREAVAETAQFLHTEQKRVRAEDIEEKFRNGLVSYADRQAERMLVERLGKLLPEAGFFTEEDTVENSEADFQWIIDPLDGTTNYLYGLAHYAVSVGLRHNDELVLGVVHHVPANEQFYAWLGGGAWCNGQRIHTSKRSDMRQALIATGFPYHNFEHAEAWFEALRLFMKASCGVRRFGSAALDLAYVAAGRYDAFFEYGLSAWDVAGGAVLVREAGGRVSDFNGGNDFLFGGSLLAASIPAFDDCLEILQRSFLK